MKKKILTEFLLMSQMVFKDQIYIDMHFEW